MCDSRPGVTMRTFVCVSVFLFYVFCFFNASAWHRKVAQVFICILYTLRPDYILQIPLLPQTPDSQKQSLSLRHNKALAYILSARSSLLMLQHMASKACEGCQPVRQTNSLPGPPTDRWVRRTRFSWRAESTDHIAAVSRHRQCLRGPP